MTAEQLLEGYDQIRKSIYSYNSIIKRSLPYAFKGLTEMSLFFSLNVGARKRYFMESGNKVFKNSENFPVDFDITKYLKPFKKTTETVFKNERTFQF